MLRPLSDLINEADEDLSFITLQKQIIELVRRRGLERRAHPFMLTSGKRSRDYIDGKYTMSQGRNLNLISRGILAAAGELGIGFTAVGGLTMGADALAHGVAVLHDCRWFSVRKESKSHGLEHMIEGARLNHQERVLVVDDVVTTGGSILTAYNHVLATGAVVVAAITMVDRGDEVSATFTEMGVPYLSLVTYKDLGIDSADWR